MPQSPLVLSILLPQGSTDLNAPEERDVRRRTRYRGRVKTQASSAKGAKYDSLGQRPGQRPR